MTEYDFSPEAFERHIRGQQRIRRWVHHTEQTPKADPYQAATPAVDVPKELLPHSRLWDSNPPWSAQPEKKPKKHRTHSEKEFDRERRNDWKYSHREHMDALRTAVAHPQTSRTKRASYDGSAPPLQSRSLHPRYPADHRFSDSQNTSSGSEYVYIKPDNPARHRSSSVQVPIRVPLPGPLPGPMPLPRPMPFYVHGPEINAQVALDDEPTRKHSRRPSPRQNQSVPTQTVVHLPPPPASAPVYPSQAYQSHNRSYSSSSPFLHQPHQGSRQQPRPTVVYPYPYAPSPLTPPMSAPAYPYPHSPAYFIPEPSKSSERKLTSEPFIKRLFLNFANQRKAYVATGETKERAASGKEGSGLLSQPSTPSPTSFAKSRTWLGSPVKNKLTKTAPKEPSETPRLTSSLDHRPPSRRGEAEAGTRANEGGMSRRSLNANMDQQRERGRGRGMDSTREKENMRDERGKESRGRAYKDNAQRKEWNGSKERDKGRWRDRSRSVSRERYKHRRDRDRERDDRHRTRHHHRERTRSLERDRERVLDTERERYRERDKDRGRDRTPRQSRPREKTARE